MLRGRTRADGQLRCGRCLEPVDWRTDTSFNLEVALAESAPLDPEIALDEADLDVIYLEKPILELEELAVEQIELELPMPVERVASDFDAPPASGLRITWLGHSTFLVELEGKRVAVIGTGATGVQVIAEIADKVAELA